MRAATNATFMKSWAFDHLVALAKASYAAVLGLKKMKTALPWELLERIAGPPLGGSMASLFKMTIIRIF